MSTAHAPMYEWKTLDWRAIERRVFKLQKRIYQASQRGDTRTVHRLQRLLIRSWSAKCLAVRRVTQDNRGKRTAGVDGVKAFTPAHRMALVNNLCLPTKAWPLRRVWIPKPGTGEQRALGIPTIRDRAAQALLKLALEPEWEAKFEPNSYGFRPGRSCHDAIQAVFISIKHAAKYVLDADIASCFDRIQHQALLTKLHTTPAMRRAIKAWLRAGVMDGPTFFPTSAGTPQGGVISPLLANIALHGLERAILAGHSRVYPPTVIRYADDFVVLHADLTVIEQAQQVAAAWLAGMGLALKASKTRITHTLHPHEGHSGFDFLGFHVRQHPVGKTHTGRNGHGQPLGFKTIIAPSKEAVSRHLDAIGAMVRSHRATAQTDLIMQLNPLIRGWTNYYATMASARTFGTLDHLVYLKLRHWARRRHRDAAWRWIIRKYWRLETGRWIFGLRGGPRLYRHSEGPIRRHTKVKGTRSPYDGDWLYWARRLGHHPTLPRQKAALLRYQKGTCAWCGRYFRVDEDLMEVDHIQPAALGGTNARGNRELIHGHCHDRKTAMDGSVRSRGAHDTS